jgi:hypothetical protein
MQIASLSAARIQRTIIGGGLGAGFGLIGVAFMAAGRTHSHRPESLIDELLLLLMGFFAGLAVGCLASGRSTLIVRGRRPAVIRKPIPVAQPACYIPEPLVPIPAGNIAWGAA